MELGSVVTTGALAALVAGALSTLVWHPLCVALVTDANAREATWRRQKLLSLVASLLLHVIAGSLLGLLYWLGWGLIAMVSVQWWERGLVFAALTWLGLGTPLILSQALSNKVHWSMLTKSVLEWMTCCALVGLGCAWSWGKGG